MTAAGAFPALILRHSIILINSRLDVAQYLKVLSLSLSLDYVIWTLAHTYVGEQIHNQIDAK
jgi:hypothetical protein